MKKNLLYLFLVIFGVLFAACMEKKVTNVSALKCEYNSNPIGIDKPKPRLSWFIEEPGKGVKQTAYQILAASSRKLLSGEQADLWDSGKINSDKSIQIPYNGKALISRQRIFWKVRIWDQEDRMSRWSEIAHWELGLLNPEDWQANWIGADSETDTSVSSPLFRKPFILEKQIRQARVYISGLGYYEFYLNGKKVSDHVLSPNQTNYDRRRDVSFQESRIGHMLTRVLYQVHDITEFLMPGENAAGVWLGGGWYIQNDRLADTFLLYDTPRFLCQIEIEFSDDSKQIITSDTSWTTHPSPLLHNGLHTGEVYDARLEIAGWSGAGFGTQSWKKSVTMRPPTGQLRAQLSPADRVIQTIEPVSMTKLENDLYRFDLGQMISGWVQLSVSGPAGCQIKLKFIEELGPSYSQTDTYILKGSGREIWEPRFTWHAFRYIDISSDQIALGLENIKGRVVNTDVATSGRFSCSNPLFNQIFKNFKWTQLGNMHGGIPSDCPHRERRGYTGDGQIAARAAIYSFDMAAFYTKWLDDIADAQNQQSGYVPNTAPYQDGGGGTAWGSAYVIIPWYMYLYYGDLEILERHYDGMKNWLAYLRKQLDKNGILVNQGLGEWVPPDINELSADFVNSCYYIYNCRLMSKIAAVLEKTDDQSDYIAWSEKGIEAINRRFFDPRENYYASGRQGANVFPLGFEIAGDLVRPFILRNLIEQLENDCQGHFDTGILATPLLLDVLTDAGHIDLAYTLMNQKDFPGFGYMIGKGATTIWETWQGDQSHSHPMFGSVSQWFFQALAGINPDESQPGFKHIIFKPYPLDGLSFVNCSYQSPYGVIHSNWKVEKGDLYLDLNVPPNTTATVYLPAQSPDQVFGENLAIRGSSNIEFIQMKNDRAIYRLGAGTYRFLSKAIGTLLPVPRLSAPDIFPADTLLYKPDSVRVKLAAESEAAEIYYTLDGRDPDRQSIRYIAPFYLKDNTLIKSRIYKENQPPGFIKERLIQFVDPKRNGLTWQYYEGEWTRLPDFARYEVKKNGRVHQFGLDKIRSDKDEFGLIFEGMLKITKPGTYTFFTLSNDGSCLFLDNQLVVNNDGGHGPLEKSGKIFLKEGLYPLKVTYFQAGGGLILEVRYSGPGIGKQEIPPGLLFLPELK